jgi:hypothetical protein
VSWGRLSAVACETNSLEILNVGGIFFSSCYNNEISVDELFFADPSG